MHRLPLWRARARRGFIATFTFLAFTFPVAAQQPAAPVLVDAPTVAGGKVVLVPRAQLRASPGTKTLRLPHTVRAALDDKSFTPPASWDWTLKDGRRVVLPMLGNDRYGDCYPVAVVKEFILMQWQVRGTQLTVDQAALVKWYLQIAGGDNGTTDEIIFPELKKGVVPPGRAHKALDQLIVPASDGAAIDLAAWAFGPQMFTFTVYQNFMTNVGPGVVFDGSSGRQLGGHAIVMSGKNAAGQRVGETWAIQPGFLATDKWVASVDPEFVSLFSLEWFGSAGYAPNGLHYTQLAPLWNSMGGNVTLVSPFPPPKPGPVPPPPPPPPPVGPGFTGDVTTTTTFVNGVPTGVKLGTAPAPAKLTRAQVEAMAREQARASGMDWQPLIDALIAALLKYFQAQNMLADPPQAVPKAMTPDYLRIDGVMHRRGADGIYRRSQPLPPVPVLKP